MRLLVLGGTLFLGRAVVAAALARGDDVTLFTRGRTNAGLFPEARRLVGDRDGDLSALESDEWDAVVDTSGYVPRVVAAGTDVLARRADRYAFVSSISAYADFSRPVDESSPTGMLDDPATEEVQEHYGALKAACERVAEDAFPGRALLVRAGLIVGPHDPTNRFTYWVTRVAEGGDVLAPGDPGRRVQFIDVRDLAEWMLRALDAGTSGVFNATGPVPPVTMGELLASCRRVSGSDARLVWVDDDFLVRRDVGQWLELPLWVTGAETAGLLAADVSRALRAGLTFRSVDETVRATLEWARAGAVEARKPGPQLPPAGLAREREAELLAGWSSTA